jgi:hypothetical protein
MKKVSSQKQKKLSEKQTTTLPEVQSSMLARNEAVRHRGADRHTLKMVRSHIEKALALEVFLY